MDLPPAEARIILALEAIRNDENLSVRAAVKLYNVYHTTILYRRAG